MKKIPSYHTRILRRGLVIAVFIAVSFAFMLTKTDKKQQPDSQKEVLEAIIERDTLIALTNYNSISYFSYRGKPMGFQYDMLTLFANFLDVELKIIINNDIETALKKLNSHECDVLAMNLAVTKDRASRVSFAAAYGQTRQVLVQKKPVGWEKMTKRELNSYLIRNQLDLANRKVHVQSNSAFEKRLRNLSDEIGANIDIVEVENYDAEQLIRLVAKGEISYTVADENVAKLNQTYYPEIDISTPVSFPQRMAWAVAKDADKFLSKLNSWVYTFKNGPMYALLYNKYFKSKKASSRIKSQYMSISGGKISPYDETIQRYSEIPNYDWRLVASMIYQESRFNPRVVSWAGAFGIMQLMPGTANYFGVSRASSPKMHIRAGCQFLDYLDRQFEDELPDKEERRKFVLASYNCGIGHVRDARRLAEKYGKNPDVWDTQVDSMLLWKSDPKYYLDPVVKYGYCRGQEPFDYVKEIMNRYEHYKNVISEDNL
ncbi:MltF family protein [Salinivirga cyanobacteriivorans]|uniref:Membrane-bound lytic murein transglycosylase F n=1 Tax=Salinivirga cyanobacteriivorans TaxID=1307839 RepID=A0A0S2HZI4_9BACT|nr:transporter substrate-binding domain-containing protein [Salinivirga cyanobacteriivorans]ALO15425.1 Membrane-bound lytic murein transglycosylase F precursor [Salinivirga cyanobacteriivorans]